ncbi:DUF3137 domain-containing protein [Maricaulis sp. CAU 1757]
MDEKRFDRIWRTVGPHLALLEGERRRVTRRRRIVFGIGGFITLLAGLAALLAQSPVLLVAAVAIAVIALIIGQHPVGQLQGRIKQDINDRLAGALKLAYTAKPAAPCRFEAFCEFGLLPAHERAGFEDQFSGEAHGCDFDLCEVHLEQKVRNGKKSYWITVFQGVVIRVSFPRKVEGITVIGRDQGWLNSLGAVGHRFGQHKLERIGLVDPVFEKVFEVYGDDQVAARYMLTPSFMERLLGLEESLSGRQVRALFHEALGRGELLIAAETGNLFEAGSMSVPLTDQRRVRRIVGELAEVLGLVDQVVAPPRDDDRNLWDRRSS